MSDCKHKWVGSAFDPIQCACCGMMLTAWQARRIRELEQRLAAVEGKGNYLIAEVRDAWEKGRISIDTKNAADELQAALHPKAQNAEDCAD